jgi:hypothetical protein
MQQAIRTWRETKKIIKQMQQLSREEIFTTLAGTKRLTPSSKKVYALSKRHSPERVAPACPP